MIGNDYNNGNYGYMCNRSSCFKVVLDYLGL